ncbi:MAG: hypothetical protein HRT57_07765, partial [Crocinitomicaceae bacterium]|nr:hypothetical protein [Crocinitomicaceae bacterium]
MKLHSRQFTVAISAIIVLSLIGCHNSRNYSRAYSSGGPSGTGGGSGGANQTSQSTSGQVNNKTKSSSSNPSSAPRPAGQISYYYANGQAQTQGIAVSAKSVKQNNSSSGTLTAGEANDLSEWELWNDITQVDLAFQKKTWGVEFIERYAFIIQNKNK